LLVVARDEGQLDGQIVGQRRVRDHACEEPRDSRWIGCEWVREKLAGGLHQVRPPDGVAEGDAEPRVRRDEDPQGRVIGEHGSSVHGRRPRRR
jgi:hypothetical protein